MNNKFLLQVIFLILGGAYGSVTRRTLLTLGTLPPVRNARESEHRAPRPGMRHLDAGICWGDGGRTGSVGVISPVGTTRTEDLVVPEN